MKIIKFLIFTLLICLLSCKKENNKEFIDNQKYTKLLWRNKNFDWVPNTLVANNKMLYFGNLNREFYCVNLETSKVNLKFKTDYDPFYNSIIFDQNIVLSEYGTDLNCFDNLGKLHWKISGEINIRKDLAENGKFIYGSVQGNGFSKLNKKDGKVIWFLPKDSNITETNKPAFLKNIIYLGFSKQIAKLLAINNENGKIIWENNYENFANISQVNTKNGLLVCLNQDLKNGEILMLNYQSGKEIWSESLNCDTYYEPCIINSNIILSTHNNKIISIDIENGKTNWILNLKKDQAESRIMNYKENLYFGTMNRNLYSINNQTGKVNFIQPFNYGISTPIVENGRIYFPTGGSEIWVLK
jgi:outer membrane protein assembly factor BamB